MFDLHSPSHNAVVGFDAKDGLHQFKNIAGMTALSSFEKASDPALALPCRPFANDDIHSAHSDLTGVFSYR